MEIINQIWEVIAPYVTGISLSGVLGAIIFGCLKGAFNKTISKINVEKISEEATEKGLEKIKGVSFSQSIQPIVESKLKAIEEEANKYIAKQLDEVQEKYDKLVLVLEKLSAYFDNSIGVTEDAKLELKEAINNAKDLPTTIDSTIIEEEKPSKKEKQETKDNGVSI